MIIFLFGPDSYRLKENVDTIVSSHERKHQSGLSFYHFDFSSAGNFDDLTNAIKSNSFFKETKLILIKNILCHKNFSEDLQAIIKEFDLGSDKNMVLVFIENQNSKELEKVNGPMFSFINSSKNLVRNIEHLTEPKLSAWVRNKFKENGQNVSMATARLLVDMVGNESWALANEIEKLCNYYISRSPASGNVTEKDVNLLVSRKEDNSIFDLIDAVGGQNKTRAFEMLYRLANSGHDPHYLLVMLVYHFENLLSVSDALSRSRASGSRDIAKKCGLHLFVARKAAAQARKFSKEGLLSKFNHLAGLDIYSKNGLVNLEDALYNFVIN